MDENNNVETQRPVYNLIDFERDFLKTKENSDKKHACASSIKKNFLGILKFYKLFTIFNVILDYDFKKSFLKDFISGLTVGICMHLPQGLAYGSLTSLAPIYGLYTSFFPGLIYMLFGTSRHLSVGTFAVTSLMVYSTVNKLDEEMSHGANKTHGGFNETLEHFEHVDHQMLKLRIATSLAFWSGLVQILLSMLRIGGISKYLSASLLSSFTTGAAFHVLTSQIQHLMGIYEIGIRRQKYFKILFTYILLAKNIAKTNWIAIVISIVAITLIIVVRIHINERFKVKMRNVPIPTELIIVIIGTTVSYFLKLDEKYSLSVVGKIPTGNLPKPSVPDLSLFWKVLPDAILIGIVSFAISISVADLYAKKHKYKINSNKEMFALGAANTFSSFFQCFSSSGALARSAVLEGSGGSSQLVTGVASVVTLAVLLWIAPLFEKLPKACLGAIIAASLVNLFKQVTDAKRYWKNDKHDFVIWMVTLFSVIIIGIDYGLFIGIILVLFINTYRSQSPKVTILGQINDTELFADIEKYNSHEVDGIKIIRFNDSLFYLNASHLQQTLNVHCPLKKYQQKKHQCLKCYKGKKNQLDATRDSNRAEIKDICDDEDNLHLHLDCSSANLGKTIVCIILDFSMVNRIDEAGIDVLKKIVKDYENENIKLLIANCNDSVIEFMKLTNSYTNQLDKLIYVTLSDALKKAKSIEATITSNNNQAVVEA